MHGAHGIGRYGDGFRFVCAREAANLGSEPIKILGFSFFDGPELVHFLCLRFLSENGRIVLHVILEDGLPRAKIFVHKVGAIVLVHLGGKAAVRFAF